MFAHYLGNTPVEGGIEEAFFDKSSIRFIRTRFGQSPPQQSDLFVIPPGELCFAAFYQQGNFYALTVVKGTDNIHIWRRNPNGNHSTTQKTVPVRNWGIVSRHLPDGRKRRIRNLTDLAWDIALVSDDPGFFPPLIPTLRKVKLYIAPGRVYISFDNILLETYVIDLPLDDRPARIMQFSPATWYPQQLPAGFSNGNSFIFDSTLIVAAIVHRQFYLAFYDLSLGVSAGRFGNDRMEVLIGTIYNQQTFGQFMVTLGSTVALAAGIFPAAIMLAPSVNTTFFKAQFSTHSLQPLSYPAFDDKSELISTFAGAKKTARNGNFSLERNGTLWLGFIDTDEQKYIVYKF